MEIKFYFQMSTCSKRAFLKTRYKQRRNFTYNPSSRLLKSLSEEHGMTIAEVDRQLRAEREFLLKIQGKK
jgi:PIN domain nuclease of toxin-antitoxin system